MPASKFCSYQNRKYTKEDARKCKMLAYAGWRTCDIAKELRTSDQWVCGVKNGTIWKKVVLSDADKEKLDDIKIKNTNSSGTVEGASTGAG